METTRLDHRTLQAADGAGAFALAVLRPARATQAVLLLPAVAGIDPYIASRAADLAAEGYAVAVLDYYRGTGHRPDLSTPQRIGEAVDALGHDGVMRDIASALGWLASEGHAASSTAILGFCVGGAFAILSAAQPGRAACGVAYYGQLRNPKTPDPITAAPHVASPLLVHVGDRDRLISGADIAAFEAASRDSTSAVEIHTYPGAPHAFDEWHRPAVFRPVASAQAWQRTLVFLDWHLKQTRRKEA